MLQRSGLSLALGVAVLISAAVIPVVTASSSLAAATVAAPAGGGVVSLGSAGGSCAAPAKPGVMRCLVLRQTGGVGVSRTAAGASATPAGLTPTALASAYKLTPTGGAGAVVAAVEAYNDPNAAADLAVYRAQFGLPACTVANGCFKQVNQNGAASPLPANNAEWAGSEADDIEMISAVCPLCKIVLVEANSADGANLYQAENAAAALATFITNGWGGAEASNDEIYTEDFNHPGVAITAAAGNSGTGAEFPATSPYVTAVGGTSLVASTNARGWTETAWASTGSGCSAYQTKPVWQTVTTGCTRRAESDVSAVADPNTGVAVYQTYGAAGWVVYGGTGGAAAIIAATYALAGTPAAGSNPASYPYAHASRLFDVVSGTNGTCSPSVLCHAGAGWDGPTGLGSPNGTAAFASPPAATFSSGFESTGPAPTWTNTVDTSGGGIANVGGICCGLTVPEAGVRSETAHTGTSALMYSGLAKGGTTTHAYAYLKVYDVSTNPVPVGTAKTLSYWIYPQSHATNTFVATGSKLSECVGVDLIFTNGSTLRDSGAVDQNGNRAHPFSQCGHLTLDTWNHVTVNLATNNANKQIARILVGFDEAGGTGGYRGYIDDLAIS